MCRIRSTLIHIPCRQIHKCTRHFLCDHCKIFRCTRTYIRNRSKPRNIHLFHISNHFVRQCRIADQRRNFGDHLDFCTAIIHSCRLLCNFLHSSNKKFSLFRIVCTDCPLKNCCLRNDICRLTSLKLSDCQNTCVRRISLSCNQLLQCKMNVYSDINRIHTRMRIGSVRTFPFDRDFKSINRIHHCAFIIIHKKSDRHLSRRYMIRKCYIYLRILKNPMLNHILTSLKCLFRRLEHEFHSSFQLAFLFF